VSHPALSHPEQRACVEALYRANPDGTAELLAAFPEGTFERCEGGHEATVKLYPSAQTQETKGSKRLEGHRQERML
jgi:hypothetical protein